MPYWASPEIFGSGRIRVVAAWRRVSTLTIPKIAMRNASEKPLLFRRSVDRSDVDLVHLMDVIEHVEDDVGLVREYVDKVAPGTRFIVTVPAFMWLWSGQDVLFEHFRRYTLAGIERVLRAVGSPSSWDAFLCSRAASSCPFARGGAAEGP